MTVSGEHVTPPPSAPAEGALPPVRRSAVRAAVAERLLRIAARRVRRPLEVIGPDGSAIRSQPGAPRMTIHRDDFFHRIGHDGNIGVAESFMAGDWSADDLVGVLVAFAADVDRFMPDAVHRLREFHDRRRPASHRNTESRAPANIAHHYDLSNEFFALWLDETMTYSSAVFESYDEDLADAQRRKYDRIAQLAGVQPGMRVLEIGTGWGGMALRLAREHGARVTSLTLSAEQAALARRRIADAGLGESVEVRVEDYRGHQGRYDAIVSIEMFEAVGEEFWPTYFSECDRLLLPGGRLGLQTITMPHDRYLRTRHAHTWIQKYIFPGGALPSQEALRRAIAAGSSLRISTLHEIGPDYAETLRRWRLAFLARLDDVSALGFDLAFERMWELYLAYSEAGFRTEAIGDVQLRLERSR